MRIPLRNPFLSARPARGGLLATLFAIAVAGMVVGFGVNDEADPLVSAGGIDPAGPSADDQPAPTASPASSESSAKAQSTLSSAAPNTAKRLNGSADTATPTSEEQAMVGTLVSSAPSTVAPSSSAVVATDPEPPTTVGVPSPDQATETATPAVDGAPATDTATPASDAATGDTATPAVDGSATTEPPAPAPATTVAPAPATTVAPSTTAGPDGWVDSGNGVLLPPVLLSIRFCESRDNYTAANPNSSARGGYQFLTGSWAAYGHADRYGVTQGHLATPAQQDEAALITWQRDGTKPWNASRSCWG